MYRDLELGVRTAKRVAGKNDQDVLYNETPSQRYGGDNHLRLTKPDISVTKRNRSTDQLGCRTRIRVFLLYACLHVYEIFYTSRPKCYNALTYVYLFPSLLI